MEATRDASSPANSRCQDGRGSRLSLARIQFEGGCKAADIIYGIHVRGALMAQEVTPFLVAVGGFTAAVSEQGSRCHGSGRPHQSRVQLGTWGAWSADLQQGQERTRFPIANTSTATSIHAS